MSDDRPLNEYIDMEAYDVVSGEQYRALAAEVDQLREALRKEWFENVLPRLDYEPAGYGTGADPVWAWQFHPWFMLLNLTDEECIAALGADAYADTEPE